MAVVLSYRERKQGWWFETKATVSCAVIPDGLLVVFDRQEVEAAMDRRYPHRTHGGDKHWYFNDSYDRECAEVDGDRVYANPSVLMELFYRRDHA